MGGDLTLGWTPWLSYTPISPHTDSGWYFAECLEMWEWASSWSWPVCCYKITGQWSDQSGQPYCTEVCNTHSNSRNTRWQYTRWAWLWEQWYRFWNWAHWRLYKGCAGGLISITRGSGQRLGTSNLHLFTCDLLYMTEHVQAISDGDIGHIEDTVCCQLSQNRERAYNWSRL